MDKILNDKERKTILSMNKYWEEVAKREDKRALRSEFDIVYIMLGHEKILKIIAAYAKKDK